MQYLWVFAWINLFIYLFVWNTDVVLSRQHAINELHFAPFQTPEYNSHLLWQMIIQLHKT